MTSDLEVPIFCDIDSQHDFELCHAILIYGNKSQQDGTYRATTHTAATIHHIAQRRGRAVIEPGHPVTVAAVEQLCRDLGHSMGSSILPQNVLLLGIGRMAWFCPARRRRIWFNPSHEDNNENEKAETKRVKALNGLEVHHPPLVFLARQGLAVYAVAEDRRPKADTPLLRTPYWNLGNGSMCRGNLKLPTQPVPDNIEAYERAFFNSAFSHNSHGDRLTTHSRGHVGLWAHLHNRKKPPPPDFWRKYLVPTRNKMTVKSLSNANPED